MNTGSKKLSVYLISNMYPSGDAPTFGIFVKNFENNIHRCGGTVFDKSVISGRGKTIAQKIKKYLHFYFSIIVKILFYQKTFDLIYIHYISHTAPLIFLLSPFLYKKLVINVHGSDVLPDSRLGLLLKPLSGLVLRSADLVVVPSDYFKQVVMRVFHVKEKDVYISPSGGIDTHKFMIKNKTSAKETFGLPPSEIVIGYVSRIDTGKGWDIFLEMIERVSDKHVIGLVAGTGAEKQNFLDKLKIGKLEDKVKYLDLVKQDKLPDVYNSMDIFVFPTIREAESLGLVGIEALACGVPVVGSCIGGVSSYVVEGYNGFLFEPGNVDDLIDKINPLLNNKEKLQEISGNCRQSVLKYDEEKIGLNLYQKLMSIIS